MLAPPFDSATGQVRRCMCLEAAPAFPAFSFRQIRVHSTSRGRCILRSMAVRQGCRDMLTLQLGPCVLLSYLLLLRQPALASRMPYSVALVEKQTTQETKANKKRGNPTKKRAFTLLTIHKIKSSSRNMSGPTLWNTTYNSPESTQEPKAYPKPAF